MATLKSVIRSLKGQKKIAALAVEKLSKEIERINAGLHALGTGVGRPKAVRKRRKMSAAGRRRIALAQKRRWAAAKKARATKMKEAAAA